MYVYDYHEECEDGNHAGEHWQSKYTRVRGVRFHASSDCLEFHRSTQKYIPRAICKTTCFTCGCVNSILYRRIKRGYYLPRNMEAVGCYHDTHRCLYTHGLRRKQKIWQDGLFRFKPSTGGWWCKMSSGVTSVVCIERRMELFMMMFSSWTEAYL